MNVLDFIHECIIQDITIISKNDDIYILTSLKVPSAFAILMTAMSGIGTMEQNAINHPTAMDHSG